MFSLSVSRIVVPRARDGLFQEWATGSLKSSLPVQSVVRRQQQASSLFSAPAPDSYEYIQIAGTTGDGAKSESFDTAAVFAERFQPVDIVTGVSRRRQWNSTTIHGFALFRFKVKEGTEAEFEIEAGRQLQTVREKEPATVLYGFFRRSQKGSSLLPCTPNAHPEYLHVMAYEDENAQKWHREIEHHPEGWAWGRIFRTFLEAPLEFERLEAKDILGGSTSEILHMERAPAPASR